MWFFLVSSRNATLKMTIHTCGECSKFFETTSKLTNHMKTHTKPFKCDKCDYKCAQPQHLKRHSTENPDSLEVQTGTTNCATNSNCAKTLGATSFP